MTDLFSSIAADPPRSLLPLTYGMDGIGRAAVFGDGSIHRPILERCTGSGPKSAMFCGVNPSYADHRRDDPTVRKLYGFGRVHGIGHWLLVNEFDFIATDVALVGCAFEPISRDCEPWIQRAAAAADIVIVGWGALAKLPPQLRERWREVVPLLGDRDLHCFGTCGDGHPRHPGRIGYDTPLIKWEPPR